MKKISTAFAIFFSLSLLFTSHTAMASERTIRVAFLPDMYGFYNIEENGEYSGYNYDYLMNLSQHTNWEYEFVVIEEGLVSTSLLKAQEMLASGEIDLLAPFSATSSNFDDFESGERNYGVYRYNLYSARNNYAITLDNFFLQETLRVGLVESYTDLNEKFFNIMEQSGVNMEITYVQTHTESHELLLNEEVDAILNLDMSKNAENLDYLTTIDHVPFYFVSTKGNTELMAELDEAIHNVEVKQPANHQILLEKYFGTKYDGDLLLTEEEMDLLSNFDTLRIGMLRNEPPYQYIDENGENAGISVDIINKLSEIIGIPFEIVWKDNHDQLAGAMARKELDMISTVPNDYPLANSLSVVLTTPYISSNAYWLRSVDEVANPDYVFHFISSSIPFFHESEMETTFDIEADLNTMNKDGTISIFCDPNITTYYQNLHQYDNIVVKAVTDVLSELCIGVSEDIDVTLVGLLNRAILFLDSYEIDEIVFNHTNVSPEYDIFDLLNAHLNEIFLIFILISGIILIYVWNNSRKFRELSRRDSLTKLYNSGYFHDYVTEKSRKIPNGVLILIDIDYFKDVNDTHGHQIGDEIIKLLARNLEKIYHTHSLVGRLGGDEFAVFLEGEVDKDLLEQKATELLKSMAENEVKVPTTLSIGGYIFEKSMEYADLFKDTDKVLYRVKDSGRNGFNFVTQIEDVEEITLFDHTLSHEIFMRKATHLMTNSTAEACHALLSLRLENVDDIQESDRNAFFKEVSDRLKHQVRRYDFICYRNNSDYLIFLDSCGSEVHVVECEQRIITALVNEYVTVPYDVKIDAKINFALYPKQGKTYKELLDAVK